MKKYLGYELLHAGTLALAEVEKNGILIDVNYVKKMIRGLEREILTLYEEIYDFDEVKEFYKYTKKKLNIDSNHHLQILFFDILGLEPIKETATGNNSVDLEVLQKLNIPISKKILRIRKLKKIKDTYLKNILAEVSDDGYIHPFFHLHLVRTYRSSSSNINFQNIPKRDKEANKIVRSAIIPPPGYRIVEIDYSGMEVKVSACYHKDQAFIGYVSNPEKDMHRDMASRIFMLPNEEISKELRYVAKNGFVFPEFYGDYFKNCAVYMWEMVKNENIKTASGKDVIKHLKSKGIKNLDKFTDRVEGIERWFWDDLFLDFARWKEEFYEEYLDKGYIDTLTGFRLWGHMRRNVVINSAIQGSAFHILLLSLILTQKYIMKKKLKSKIIGQIHDSLVMYVHESEFDHIIKAIKYIATKRVREIWDWIIVPLEIEIEVSKEGWPWSVKEQLAI